MVRQVGSPLWPNGEDQFLLRRFEVLGTPTADPMGLGFEPFVVGSLKAPRADGRRSRAEDRNRTVDRAAADDQLAEA